MIPTLKDKTNKAYGNIQKIEDTLNGRPFGKHRFKAAILMRKSMLVGSLLNNAKTMINITKSDLDKLEKPDIVFQKKLFDTTIKPAKAFCYLELGIKPLRYEIMEKRLSFLKYILEQKPETMMKQVYDQQRVKHKKGDFVDQVEKDKIELEMKLEDKEIN